MAPADGLKELAVIAGVELADDGYLARSKTNGSSAETATPGVFVAGCASGPKNIRDSIADAQMAAAAALDRLDPRVLQTEAPDADQIQRDEPSPSPATEDMRSQIEKLLYALIDQ